MHITQLRNATVLVEFESAGRPIGLLVDPMLAPRGALPALRYLGGGRQRAGDAIDPRVGLSRVLPLGSPVQAGQPLLWLHAATPAAADVALASAQAALQVADAPPQLGPLLQPL